LGKPGAGPGISETSVECVAPGSVISHQRTDGNVFVDIRPMNTNPFADQSPVLTLGR
jgi:hypothetical protein